MAIVVMVLVLLWLFSCEVFLRLRRPDLFFGRLLVVAGFFVGFLRARLPPGARMLPAIPCPSTAEMNLKNKFFQISTCHPPSPEGMLPVS
jgi:hypothetical protein